MNTSAATSLITLVVAGLFLTGCGRHASHDHDHDHAEHAESGHGHAHVAPHGGTVVVLGDEAFHLELVRDGADGTLTAWVLDAHLENFIRIEAREIALIAVAGGTPQALSLFAVSNPATGETEGDTSEFTGQAEWLKTAGEFEVVVPSITVRGVTFTDVRFGFPEGHEGH
jgi:hypothetical protein